MSEPPASEALTSERTDRVAGLFDAHVERLYRLARRLTPAADDALDLIAPN